MKNIITLFLIFSVLSIASAESKKVPIRIDHEYYSTSELYLDYNSVDYNVEIGEFLEKVSDEYELTFFELFDAIEHKDSKRAGKIANVQVEKKDPKSKNFLKNFEGYNKLVSKLKEKGPILLDSQVLAGEDRIFLWGNKQTINDKVKSYRRAYKIKKKSDGSLEWDPNHDSLMNMLSLVTQEHRSDPQKYLSSKKDLKYKVPIYGENSKNPVSLQFDGRLVEFDIFKDDEPGDEILSFYQQTYKGLVLSSKTKAKNYYTKKSGDKFAKWVNKMEEHEFDAYRKDILERGRVVTFVMNLDPVFIVFYRFNDERKDTYFVHYDYIVNSPNNGLKLTNFYYYDRLDEIIKGEEFRDSLESVLGLRN